MGQQPTVKVSGDAGDLWDLREVELRIVRRVHVYPEFREQNGAADTVPVAPASKVPLRQALRFHDMMDDHPGNVETTQACGPRAEVPFALRLIPQGAGLPSEAVVEQVRPIEGLTSRGGIDAERPWNAAHTELDRPIA